MTPDRNKQQQEASVILGLEGIEEEIALHSPEAARPWRRRSSMAWGAGKNLSPWRVQWQLKPWRRNSYCQKHHSKQERQRREEIPGLFSSSHPTQGAREAGECSFLGYQVKLERMD
jgi:hypothetical protein